MRIRKEKGEVIDMWCMEDEWIKEGQMLSVINIARRMMLKGYDVEQVADITEENDEVISRIFEIVNNQKSDYDARKVYEELQKLTI